MAPPAIQRVLLTGNQGYIGSVLAEMLLNQQYDVIGLDTNYYNDDCLFYPQREAIPQISKDIRDVNEGDLENVDAIIHLAALSNDPLGFLDPRLTDEINCLATVRLARLAKAASVTRFVFASSQSMYGKSTTDKELAEEQQKNPITPYGKTKWEAELGLKKLNSDDFTVVCFRPSTVFGSSPKLRLDIVFNSLISTAFTKKKVEIKSDGTPWRPVVHIRDVSQAFIAGLRAPKEIIGGRSYNVGVPHGNYQVKELADHARRAVPGSRLSFLHEVRSEDERTYRISFENILRDLGDCYKPEWDLERGAQELIAAFKHHNLTAGDCTGRRYIRLNQLTYLRANNKLDENLRWTH